MRAATRLRIYCDPHRHAGPTPLATAIVQFLWKENASGVTLFRGAHAFDATTRPPIGEDHAEPVGHARDIVEWVDSPERIDELWPRLRELVGDAVTVRDTVDLLVPPHHALRRLPHQVLVGEVMRTDLVTVTPDTPLERVVHLMLGEEVRFVPVVDGQDLVGVVTNSDLVERGGLPLRLELQHVVGGPPPSMPRTAGAVMTRDVVTTAPSRTVHEAAQQMIARRVKRLPVVDERRLVGLVSRVDLLHIVAGVFPATVTEPPSRPAAAVGEITVPEVPTVRADTAVADILDAVVSTRLNRAVVVDDDRHVIGIVTDAELLRRVDAPDRSLLDRLMRRGRGSPEAVGKRARDLMVSPVSTVDRSTPIHETIRRMLSERHKLLPVVDEEGRLCGMVDRADVLRAAFASEADDRG